MRSKATKHEGHSACTHSLSCVLHCSAAVQTEWVKRQANLLEHELRRHESVALLEMR